MTFYIWVGHQNSFFGQLMQMRVCYVFINKQKKKVDRLNPNYRHFSIVNLFFISNCVLCIGTKSFEVRAHVTTTRSSINKNLASRLPNCCYNAPYMEKEEIFK